MSPCQDLKKFNCGFRLAHLEKITASADKKRGKTKLAQDILVVPIQKFT
jgi:hypothetical protein